ncbi:hypothetical protein SCALM49S_09674 [Streptomyces californicus]
MMGASTSMEEIFTREAGAYGSGRTGSPSTGGPAASAPVERSGRGGLRRSRVAELRAVAHQGEPAEQHQGDRPPWHPSGPLATGVVPAHGSPFVATL